MRSRIYSMESMKISERIDRGKQFFKEEIWNIDLGSLTRFKARFVQNCRIVMITLRTFSAQKIGFQSVALSFFCTMAAIPFLAVAFVITGGFGLDEYVTDFLYENIDDPAIIQTVTSFASNIIKTAQSSAVGLISALLFVWLVIWMMICVERVFNNVWQVKKRRRWYKSFGVDMIILVLSPFIIVLFFAGSVVYSNILDLLVPNKIAFSQSLRSLIGWIIFGVISVAVISAMYKFIPSCKVRYRNAFRAAVLSGISFTVLQYLYLETQVFVTRLNAIYGALAAIPLFMFWLNFGWYIILLGAELSYAYQNVDKYILSQQNDEPF